MEATVKPRLARGLNALLGDLNDLPTTRPVDSAASASPADTGSGTSGSGMTRVPIAKIKNNPYQPRKQFDDDELLALAESITQHGVLQPLLVRVHGDDYQLIAGERRLRAAQAAGLTEVPVSIVAFDDQQVFEAALVENIQRTDLNPIEKGQGFKQYMDQFQMTQEQLAARLGLDRTTVSNFIGLLSLPEEVQAAVRNGQLTMGHAKVLRAVYDQNRLVALAKEAIMKNYSVHALELLVKQQKYIGAIPEPAPEAKPAAARVVVEKTAHVKGIEDELRQRLAVKVEIKVKAKDKGQIVIGFESNDDFERIVQALQRT